MKGITSKTKSCARHGLGYTKMSNSKNYLAPLGLAVVGAIFGIGHFGGLHETVFGSENEYEIVTSSYYDETYSPSSNEYDHEISFRGKKCSGSVGCNCSGFAPITSGDEWQKSICKHCGHKKSCHK